MNHEPFASLNVYYDKIYVLTVASASERRKLFAERFQGLKYEFFYGADKNNFTIEELERQNVFSEKLARQHHRFSKTMRPGEIACSWSHRMMYEEMIARNYRRILIFEDDAVPDLTMIKKLDDIIQEIPATCELLMWGWAKNNSRGIAERLKQFFYHFQHLAGKLKWDHRMIKNIYAKPYSKYLMRAGFHDYTYAYAINLTGAKKLLEMQSPVQYIADNLLAHAVTKEIVNGFIVNPPVFLHDNLTDGTHRDSYIR